MDGSQTAMEKAKANLAKAKLDVLAAKAQVALQETRVKSARELFEELTIKSPTDGTVLDLLANPGDLIEAGDFNLPRCEARCPHGGGFASNPRGLLGRNVKIMTYFGNKRSQTVSAKVSFVSPIADPVTGKFRFRCDFSNLDADGKPIAYPDQKAKIVIPSK